MNDCHFPLMRLTLGLLLFWTVGVVADAEEAAKKVTYVDHVQPIFRQHCFSCHGPDQKKNDLALNTYAAAMAGGASGDAVIAGDTSSSYLWLLVNHEMEPAMPPGGAKLPQAELDVIKAWIEGGLLEKGDSVAKKPAKSAVATFTPTADNKPAGEPAMPQGLLKEPVLHTATRGAPTAVATSPWAPVAAIGSAYQISLYNTDSGELLGVLPFVEGSPYVLRFSRDGSVLLAGGGKSAALGIVALFDVKSGRRLATIGDELDAVLAADIRADLSLVALGGPRKTVKVYKVADGSLAYEITKHTDWVTAIEFSPDGKLLATGDRAGGLLAWDADTGRERGDLRGHVDQVTGVSWRGDSAVLASSSEDDNAKLWKVADSTQIKTWLAHAHGVGSVQFARDGQLVTSGRDALVKLWKSDGAALRDLPKLDDFAMAARFTHDAKRVVACDWRGNVRVYDAEKGEAVATLDPNPPTIDARLATTEAEVNSFRTASQSTAEQVAAAQQQVAAAQSALEQAQKDAAAKMQLQTEVAAKLGTAEEQLAATAKEKAALLEATSKITVEMATVAEELAAAEAMAKAKLAEREAAKAEMAGQEAAVSEVAAQLAELQKKVEAAQAGLKALAEAYAAKEQEAAGAEGKVSETQGKIAELERRQAELEAVRKLREQFGAKP
jgi:WD40 repeat protein/mono/diheme cytochrome c family protein